MTFGTLSIMVKPWVQCFSDCLKNYILQISGGKACSNLVIVYILSSRKYAFLTLGPIVVIIADFYWEKWIFQNTEIWNLVKSPFLLSKLQKYVPNQLKWEKTSKITKKMWKMTFGTLSIMVKPWVKCFSDNHGEKILAKSVFRKKCCAPQVILKYIY